MPSGLWTKDEYVVVFVLNPNVPLRTFRGVGEETAIAESVCALSPAIVNADLGEFIEVQPGTSHVPVIQIKPQRFHKM